MSRSEMAMARQAITNDWAVSQEHRQAVIKAAKDLLKSDKPRARAAACRILLAADSLNIRARQAKRPAGFVPPSENIPTKEDVLRSMSPEDREKVFQAEELLEKACEAFNVAPESDSQRLLWVVKHLLSPEQQQAYIDHHFRNKQHREAHPDDE